MQTAATPCTKRLSGNIFLVGMMGSGKTTMGRLLAKKLDKTFIDCDEEIQKRTGVSITHIFDVEGEAGFRKRESAVVRELVQMNNIVLATGGGAVLDKENRAMLASNGTVIYLKGSVHDLWHRTRHDRSRPLLQTEDPLARLKELYKQRDPLYAEVADLVVQSGKQSAQHLMLKLLQELEQANNLQMTSCKH